MSEKCGFVDPELIKEKPRQISTDFLTPILDTPLTVERIDNYADDAVNELIFLLNQKVDDYKSGHNTGGWDDKSIENAALKFYGLESISDYLDFLAEKDAEIRSLDKVIKKAGQVGGVIVKPDSYSPNIVSGNGGEMKEKKMISRVKTVLFILKEDFEVDIDDETQLTLKKGILRDNMMRKTSYFLISVPKIDRTLLVCDEEGNASYVFDNKVLKDRDITEGILINSTKEELNELIQQTPELGKRVVYSKDGFVPRIIDAIEKPESKRPDEMTKEMKNIGKYLYEKPREGELSCRGLAEKIRIGDMTLKEVIDSIDPEELGEVNRRKFGSKVTLAYNQEQQKMIIKKAEERGSLTSPPKENELPCLTLSKELGVSIGALQRAIDSMPPGELGEVTKRKFGSKVTLAYNQEQQEKIRKYLESRGLLSFEPAEGELSCQGLAEKFGINNKTLKEVIDSIDIEELGEVNRRKFGGVAIALAYTMEQQWKIIEYIREHKKSLIKEEKWKELDEEKRKWMESKSEG